MLHATTSGPFARVLLTRAGRGAHNYAASTLLSTWRCASTTTRTWQGAGKGMPTNVIRERFTSYFQRLEHTHVASSSLIPEEDDTLLFTNSGMVQFKRRFLGAASAPYTRATTAQNCLRAGGKHNDLDNVGHTSRHHTYFEMMGNFSFGDYFREEAIVMAHQLLITELQMPLDRLCFSVHRTDRESFDVWKKVCSFTSSEADRRIWTLGDQDNLWSMGNNAGPLGVCTEIFWDQQQLVDGERFLEIWNLVLMEKERLADGSTIPLAAPSIDTGMGLERFASVLQGVQSNYEIDTLSALLRAAKNLFDEHSTEQSSFRPLHELLAGHAAGDAMLSKQMVALRVVVDHMRATCMLISDGVLPNNTGRGYVLRRIMRRAIKYAHSMGVTTSCLYRLYDDIVTSLPHPQLRDASNRALTMSLIKNEEEQFFHTLEHGLGMLQAYIRKTGTQTIGGELAFTLYDACGFPLDITQMIAKEHGMQVDVDGFNERMEQQRRQSKESHQLSTSVGGVSDNKALADAASKWEMEGIKSEFVGYTTLSTPANVLAIHRQGGVEGADQVCWVILDKCPFYPQGGGQVGDRGLLVVGQHRLAVIDAKKLGEAIGVCVRDPSNALAVGMKVVAEVDEDTRHLTACHHTGTHLLHAALRNSWRPEVNGVLAQAGSLVTHERLRFDFTCHNTLKEGFMEQVEADVNQFLLRVMRESSQRPSDRGTVSTSVMSLHDARQANAVAQFGEKYGDVVRVVQILGYSTELCGGTHVSDIRSVYPFKIVSSSSVSSTTRRIEALAGTRAVDWMSEQSQALQRIARSLNVGLAQVEPCVSNQGVRISKMFKQLKEAQSQAVTTQTAHGAGSSHTPPAVTAHNQELQWEKVDLSWNNINVCVRCLASQHSDWTVEDSFNNLKKAQSKLLKEEGGVHVLMCGSTGAVLVAMTQKTKAKTGSTPSALLAAILPEAIVVQSSNLVCTATIDPTESRKLLVSCKTHLEK